MRIRVYTHFLYAYTRITIRTYAYTYTHIRVYLYAHIRVYLYAYYTHFLVNVYLSGTVPSLQSAFCTDCMIGFYYEVAREHKFILNKPNSTAKSSIESGN